ncbi:MAG TPA: GTP cyclohydrolase I FolE [Lentisphaeria bacterium]|nr:MAG: GTP cyclohydrolase I FolE [Lentisphaerae bacterium GWF2_38_69]HBM16121.1 GTP cyclohydrolase I FolE [Lentisphaeria bacterium]
MEKLIKDLLIKIGEDPNREGLVNTPHRVAKSWKFLTKGYTESIDDIIKDALFESENCDMIIVRDIEFYSLCEHHMLPFYGKCHVGYLPNKKIIGVSKLARIVDVFARRLQLQERLSRQIGETIIEKIGARGVGIVIEAQHMCMTMRGVEKQHSKMVTSSMLGSFRTSAVTRNEFLNLISQPSNF